MRYGIRPRQTVWECVISLMKGTMYPLSYGGDLLHTKAKKISKQTMKHTNEEATAPPYGRKGEREKGKKEGRKGKRKGKREKGREKGRKARPTSRERTTNQNQTNTYDQMDTRSKPTTNKQPIDSDRLHDIT